MFAFMKQPEYKPAQTGPEADAKYRFMRWQVFIGAFIGYAGFYLVRKNLSMAIPRWSRWDSSSPSWASCWA